MAFVHCQFDCAEECSRHQQSCETPTLPAHNPLPNPNAHINHDVQKNCAPTPMQGPGSPVHPKRKRDSVNPSLVTPNHDDEPCGQISKTPSVRVTGRVTRSMVAKANVVKPSAKDSKGIETIVLDDE